MEKISIQRPGGYRQLRCIVTPDLEPAAGEVVVATAAASVNYADCMVRMGLYGSARKYVGWPITPGFDFSGTVLRLGPGCQRFEPGQPVFGITRFGAYASQVCVPESQLFAIPSELDFVRAAALPTVYLTAWYALRELCKLRPGMRVLVHSGAGGVGLMALQLARLHQALPVAVVGGSHKVAIAEAHGAHAAIDKSHERWEERARAVAPSGYQVVLDPNGAATLKHSYRLLAPTGRLVVYGFSSMLSRGRALPNPLRILTRYLQTPRFNPMQLTAANKSVMAFNLSYLFDHQRLLAQAMEELLEALEQKRVRPPPVATFQLADAARAHRELESGDTVGKLVLTVEQPQPA